MKDDDKTKLPEDKANEAKALRGALDDVQKLDDGIPNGVQDQIKKIDGLPILAEDIDFMPGEDVMALMQSFGANFTSRQSK